MATARPTASTALRLAKPVEEPLPFPRKPAQNKLSELIVDRFGHRRVDADAISRASLDPTEDRAHVIRAERKRIAGGWLDIARMYVSPLALVPDVTNVRTYEGRHYPSSGAQYGSGSRAVAYPPV